MGLDYPSNRPKPPHGLAGVVAYFLAASSDSWPASSAVVETLQVLV